MEKALTTVKEFSPYGWGITVLVLVLQFVTDVKSTGAQKDLHQLQLTTKISQVEAEMKSIRNELEEVKDELIASRKMVCKLIPERQRQFAECL